MTVPSAPTKEQLRSAAFRALIAAEADRRRADTLYAQAAARVLSESPAMAEARAAQIDADTAYRRALEGACTIVERSGIEPPIVLDGLVIDWDRPTGDEFPVVRNPRVSRATVLDR